MYYMSFEKTYECDIGIVIQIISLRGEESAMDMRFVEQLANRLDLPFYGTKLEVPARVEVRRWKCPGYL